MNGQLGSRMSDGTIYAGLSRVFEGKAIYVLPEDLPGSSEGANYAKVNETIDDINGEKAHGYNDWQLPPIKDAIVVVKNMNKGDLSGTFTGVSGAGETIALFNYYWTQDTQEQYGKAHVVTFNEDHEIDSSPMESKFIASRAIRYGEPPVS